VLRVLARRRLRRQHETLARDLARTQAALEIMGKAHALGTTLRERGGEARAGAEQVIDNAFAELADADVDVRGRVSW
jgi:hypothetical protein